jgi:Raf kinase inhibitor-like YbhB/YbcL family protein
MEEKMNKRVFFILYIGILLLFTGNAMAFELTSIFKNGEKIPKLYTCDGKDISPPLSWQDAPVETKSFVLIMDDPDAPAGTWDHWIVYNIPANTQALEENLQTLPAGAMHGKNSWNKFTYGGPCPPANSEHRYFFKLYAIDTLLPSTVGLTKQEVEKAMLGHVITSTELVGKYQREK